MAALHSLHTCGVLGHILLRSVNTFSIQTRSCNSSLRSPCSTNISGIPTGKHERCSIVVQRQIPKLRSQTHQSERPPRQLRQKDYFSPDPSKHARQGDESSINNAHIQAIFCSGPPPQDLFHHAWCEWLHPYPSTRLRIYHIPQEDHVVNQEKPLDSGRCRGIMLQRKQAYASSCSSAGAMIEMFGKTRRYPKSNTRDASAHLTN